MARSRRPQTFNDRLPVHIKKKKIGKLDLIVRDLAA